MAARGGGEEVRPAVRHGQPQRQEQLEGERRGEADPGSSAFILECPKTRKGHPDRVHHVLHLLLPLPTFQLAVLRPSFLRRLPGGVRKGVNEGGYFQHRLSAAGVSLGAINKDGKKVAER